MKKNIIGILIISIFLSLFFSIVLCGWNSPCFTVRGQNEGTVSISDNIIIEQKIPSIKLKSISINMLINKEDESIIYPESKIVINLIQGEKIQKKEVYLNDLKRSGWQLISPKFDFTKFSEKEITLSITGENLAEGVVNVLISDGQQVDARPYTTINGDECTGYLQFNYGFRNYEKIGYYFGILCVLFICISFIILGLGGIYKRFPITATAIVLDLVFAIRFSIWTIQVDGWILGTWLSDYRYGFVNRGLAASIVTAITKIFHGGNDYISLQFLKKVLLFLTLLVAVIVIYAIYKQEKESEQTGTKKEIENILVLWVMGPCFFTFFLTSTTFGRIDILLVALFMLSILSIKFTKARYFLIPILTLLGILVYEGYLFFFFPSIFVIMLAYAYYNKEKKLLYAALGLAVVAILLSLYIHYNGTLNGKITMEAYYQEQQSRTNGQLDNTQAVTYPFGIYDGSIESDIHNNHLYYRMILFVMAMAPSLLYFENICLHALKNGKNKMEKLIFSLLVISPFSLIFTINHTASDYLRYFVQTYMAFVITIVLIVQMNKSSLKDAAYETNLFFEKRFGNNFITILAVSSLVIGFTYGTCWPFTDLTTSIVNITDDLINYIR